MRFVFLFSFVCLFFLQKLINIVFENLPTSNYYCTQYTLIITISYTHIKMKCCQIQTKKIMTQTNSNRHNPWSQLFHTYIPYNSRTTVAIGPTLYTVIRSLVSRLYECDLTLIRPHRSKVRARRCQKMNCFALL